MKYIRTKDGRILEINKMVTPCVYETKPNKQGVYEEIGNGLVDKVADTIEELCDTYVIKGEYGNFLVPVNELNTHAQGQTKELLLDAKLECYGAIWIEIKLPDGRSVWRLEPAAIMNDKGELELL